jgi:hypothetical protein
MPGTRKAATKKPAAKKPAAKATGAKRGAPRGPREAIVTPEKATFDTDDKRAQYARLVIFNFAKSKDSKAKVPSGADVNSVSDAVLTSAGKELVNGNMIKGADGLDFIMSLSKDGSTTGRPLTKAYAAEVRPFLRRLKLAPEFSRRGGSRKAKEAAAENGGEAAEKDSVEAAKEALAAASESVSAE